MKGFCPRELRPPCCASARNRWPICSNAQMPRLDGIEATRRIKRAFPMVGILFFSVFTDYVEAGLAAGADGYLPKDCEPDQLVAKASEIVAGIRSKVQERGRS